MGEVYGALITLLALWKTLLQPGEITQHMPSYRISLRVSKCNSGARSGPCNQSYCEAGI